MNNQTYLFLIFTLNGFLIGILFDFFRIIRKSSKTNDITTYVEDILFWIMTGGIILYSMCTFSDGQLRFFMILGIIIGVVIYILALSKYVINVCVFVIDIIFKKILLTIIRCVISPFVAVFKIIKKYIIRPISRIFINNGKKIGKYLKKIVKKRGFFAKKEKYNNIDII